MRRGLRFPPFVVGGAQERARRGGIEDVPAIVGFGAAAAELGERRLDARRRAARADRAARRRRDRRRARRRAVRRSRSRACRTSCASAIDGVEAEPILLALDQHGVAVHSGSSCSSEALEPSPVLAAMGVDADRSLRVSVGWSSTDADVDAFLAAFPERRRIAPRTASAKLRAHDDHRLGRTRVRRSPTRSTSAPPPLAITFSDAPLDGVAPFDEPMPEPLPDGRTGRVPAGCVFWMKAADRTFGTVAEDHGNCSVGSLTHGFKTLDEVAGNSDVAALLETGWVTMDVVPADPGRAREAGRGHLRPARRDARSIPTSCSCASPASS